MTAKKKTSKKKVTKKTTKAVATTEEDTKALAAYDEAFGTEDIDNEDIIIPKVLVMQGMSKRVTEGKAKLGDMVDSLTGEILGDTDTPIDFIPFKTFKTWIVFHNDEYKETIPVTPKNKDWPIEDKVDGVHVRRDKVFNCYCLLPEQIESGEFLPFVLSFRRTSYYAGRKLTTAFARLRMFKKPAFSKVFRLSSEKQTKDKHTFFTFDVEQVGNSNEKHMVECKNWYDVVSKAKVDDSDLQSTEREVGGKQYDTRNLGAEEQGFQI